MAMNEKMKQDLNLVGRYLAVIVVSLILASILGSMDLFVKTYVIPSKLNAASLVKFMGYSTALGSLWMLGRRATIFMQQHGGRWAFVEHLILPVVTLIVVSSVNSVALLVLKPVMTFQMNNIYNWIFIFGILGCAVWVIMAVLGQSAPLTEAFTAVAGKESGASVCKSCGSENVAEAKYCTQCGKVLA
jgi:hypothetical protein